MKKTIGRTLRTNVKRLSTKSRRITRLTNKNRPIRHKNLLGG